MASSVAGKKDGGTEGEKNKDLSSFSLKFQSSLLKARLEKELAVGRELKESE